MKVFFLFLSVFLVSGCAKLKSPDAKAVKEVQNSKLEVPPHFNRIKKEYSPASTTEESLADKPKTSLKANSKTETNNFSSQAGNNYGADNKKKK